MKRKIDGKLEMKQKYVSKKISKCPLDGETLNFTNIKENRAFRLSFPAP
jgi:hypothetical protein